MIGKTLFNIIHKNVGMGGSKPRAYCGMKSGPWCNAYVCYGFNQAGAKNLYYGGKKVTYCPTSIKWCQAHLAQLPIYLAMPGDVIYFDWNANNVPDHIGFVKSKTDSSKISTHEGNTNGGIVAEKSRPNKYVLGVFRPLYTPTGLSKTKLKVDGSFEYQSIYNLQVALKLKPTGIFDKATVKAWQKKVGAAQDGAWGRKTTLASQKFLHVKQDAAWGADSTKALQKWINSVNFPVTKTAPVKVSTPASAPAPVKTSASSASKTTPTRKKMSKIGHAMKDYDHKAGDSSGDEVKKSSFTYKTSSSSVYNWTYVFRPKDIAKANKAADMCEKAIKNNNIGYNKNGETAYGKKKAMSKLAKAVKYDLSKITTKCGLSCGDLICLCNRWAGLSTCYIGSGKQLAANLKKNKNFTCYKYKKGMQLYRGDTLITAHSNGKNNHVVMCL